MILGKGTKKPAFTVIYTFFFSLYTPAGGYFVPFSLPLVK
jgi:hypothetical protein